jgi:drug/metabolite transporter (DMT)-like permease
MSPLRIVVLTAVSMTSFAANSLLCRIALKNSVTDAVTFTTLRLIFGALTLWLITRGRRTAPAGAGNWVSALALFVYAAAFSFAYVRLTAATGALLLVGGVQATMIGYGVFTGERLLKWQIAGLLLALGGLLCLFLPGLAAPPLSGSLMMTVAGVAWGVYSLRGKGRGDPTKVTGGNFLRAAPISLALSIGLVLHAGPSFDIAGVTCAIASGAVASGLGYVVWYTVLPALKATTAATLHLSVPVITAMGGIIFLHESLTLRLALASAAILGGVALVVLTKQHGEGGLVSQPAR